MVFIETKLFTKRISEFLSDEDYRLLQIELIGNPEKGAVIKGGKGLRKMRWTDSTKGKRGGIRIIYYYQVSEEEILMLYAYKKNEAEDITKQQLKQLIGIIEERYK
jgi:mRNA-degrading endonuclease RelE of RelBE toxin-antitoxin system